MQENKEVKSKEWQDVLYESLDDKDTPQWIIDLKKRPNTTNNKS